ncbi:MAG: ATP synthase subunit I [Luteolibacter sp.]
MNDPLTWILAGAAGVALGAIFFGGLWWTIQKGLASPRPATLFLTSVVLRLAVAIVGFYFVSGGQWRRLLACLVGFVVARLTVTWLTRDKGRETGDAS